MTQSQLPKEKDCKDQSNDLALHYDHTNQKKPSEDQEALDHGTVSEDLDHRTKVKWDSTSELKATSTLSKSKTTSRKSTQKADLSATAKSKTNMFLSTDRSAEQ